MREYFPLFNEHRYHTSARVKTKIIRTVLSSMLGKYANTATLNSSVLLQLQLQLTATPKAKVSGIQPVPLFYGIESDYGNANNENEEEERWFSSV